MPSKARQYVLDSSVETDRLDSQSRMSAYDFKDELRGLQVLEGHRILDAGCGSGIVTDYLSRLAPDVKVVGMDYSGDRIQEARSKYGSAENIRFVQKSLLDLDEKAAEFDTIICRYVLRHFSARDGKRVIANLFRALKPGGKLYCIDVEGVMGEVYPASPFLKRALRKIREAKAVDFQVARKMPFLLEEQGFESVDWNVIVSEFKKAELSREIENLEKAIHGAAAFAKQVLGGSASFDRFRKEYLSTLQRPGLVLFYNKVVVAGTKPGLKLVRGK